MLDGIVVTITAWVLAVFLLGATLLIIVLARWFWTTALVEKGQDVANVLDELQSALRRLLMEDEDEDD